MIICDYCGDKATYEDSSVIYGRSYGMVYICKCVEGWAYVGVHKGTNKPLGRLADKTLREMKKKAHSVFDPMWKSGGLSRKQAYSWLADKLSIKGKDCHIGMFDCAQCTKVMRICQ